MQDSYEVIEVLAKAKVQFRGNSMKGDWIGGRYVVRSYNTEIASYDPTTRQHTIRARKISVTTTKQQNLMRRVWKDEPNLEIVE